MIDQIVTDLSSRFALKTLGTFNYFLGFEVHRNKEGLLLTQAKYAQDLLSKAGLSDCKPCFTPMATGTRLMKEDDDFFDQPSLYKSLVGGLQ